MLPSVEVGQPAEISGFRGVGWVGLERCLLVDCPHKRAIRVFCWILSTLQFPDPKEPLFIPKALLTVGPIEYPLAGYSRIPFVVRSVGVLGGEKTTREPFEAMPNRAGVFQEKYCTLPLAVHTWANIRFPRTSGGNAAIPASPILQPAVEPRG